MTSTLDKLHPILAGDEGTRVGPGEIALTALREAQDNIFRVGELMRTVGALEADRHARKEAAIARLMERDSKSYTAAEKIVNSDPEYNEYLKHQSAGQAKLEETREILRLNYYTARLATAVVEQGVVA